MFPKTIMTSSAILMGAVGIILTFAPKEMSDFISGSEASSSDVIVFQILGALYFAFAMTNWSAKANLIGGIYGRPIAIGNLTHFMIAALALGKAFTSDPSSKLLIATLIYALFAIAFAYIFFTHPIKS